MWLSGEVGGVNEAEVRWGRNGRPAGMRSDHRVRYDFRLNIN